jgi:hypothetical protein
MFSMKRESGDRPDANLGLFNFDGRVEEHEHKIHVSDRVAAASGPIPLLSLSIRLSECLGATHAR